MCTVLPCSMPCGLSANRVVCCCGGQPVLTGRTGAGVRSAHGATPMRASAVGRRQTAADRVPRTRGAGGARWCARVEVAGLLAKFSGCLQASAGPWDVTCGLPDFRCWNGPRNSTPFQKLLLLLTSNFLFCPFKKKSFSAPRTTLRIIYIPRRKNKITLRLP